MSDTSRLAVACLLSPVMPGILAAVLELIFGSVEGAVFMLSFSVLLGYPMAIIFGAPAYFLFFRRMKNISKKHIFFFAISIVATFALLYALFIAFSGSYYRLEGVGFWIYLLLFAVATFIAAYTFYYIAFFKKQ